MSGANQPIDPKPIERDPRGAGLETLAAIVLLLVLAALAWMVLAAYWPAAFSVAPVETEVIAMLVLLTAALLLVSVVALVHTR
jgi:hypothetical protein